MNCLLNWFKTSKILRHNSFNDIHFMAKKKRKKMQVWVFKAQKKSDYKNAIRFQTIRMEIFANFVLLFIKMTWWRCQKKLSCWAKIYILFFRTVLTIRIFLLHEISKQSWFDYTYISNVYLHSMDAAQAFVSSLLDWIAGISLAFANHLSNTQICFYASMGGPGFQENCFQKIFSLHLVYIFWQTGGRIDERLSYSESGIEIFGIRFTQEKISFCFLYF